MEFLFLLEEYNINIKRNHVQSIFEDDKWQGPKKIIGLGKCFGDSREKGCLSFKWTPIEKKTFKQRLKVKELTLGYLGEEFPEKRE